MRTTFKHWFFLLAFVNTLSLAIGIRNEEIVKEEMGGVSDIYGGERIKRVALNLIGDDCDCNKTQKVGGELKYNTCFLMAALLRSARVRSVSRFSTVYIKRGGYGQALADFKRLEPTVQVRNGASRWGQVNGRPVTIRKDADKTTLDIWKRVYKPHGKVHIYVDKIEYTD